MSRLVLASTSPRRRELLAQLGLPFECIAPPEEERPEPGEAALGYVLRAARDKAVGVASANPDAFVLGSDTIVVLGERIMGKPETAAEAREMLTALSGKTHEVMTAVVLAKSGGEIAGEKVVATAVTFRDLSEEEIATYVASGEPMDKAGAYAIQGGAGAMVRRIEGSYTNVVGFPLAVVGDMLQDAGVV